MVLKIFAALSGLVKVRQAFTDVDSYVFRLHYRLTASFCLIACGLISASEYIGDPIQCMDNKDPVSSPINTYCWISSTFTINSTNGLGNHEAGNFKKTYHNYYQWVPFVLFFQGCLFYLPHLFWKAIERKNADTLLQGLHRYSIDPDIEKKKENIIKYLKASKGQNMQYSLLYHIFEFLNFVNVLGQMFMMDAFLGGAFMEFGTKVVTYALDDIARDPFNTVFPKVTKCAFSKYGPSGTEIKLDLLCILTQNILNEKVFIMMWFWFIILASITGVQLVWRLVLCLSPVLRVKRLEQRGLKGSSPNLERAIQRLQLGDFFLLDILGRNLDASTFRAIVKGAIIEGEADLSSNALYPPLPAVDYDDTDGIRMNEIRN